MKNSTLKKTLKVTDIQRVESAWQKFTYKFIECTKNWQYNSTSTNGKKVAKICVDTYCT